MENMVIDDRLLFFGSLFISLSATHSKPFMVCISAKLERKSLITIYFYTVKHFYPLFVT